MSSWMLGLGLAIVVAVVAVGYLWIVRRRANETAAGLQALAGMRWGAFSLLVRRALEQRGLQAAVTTNDESREPSSRLLLERGGERWLVACKHGSAYRIGAAALEELAAEIRLASAAGGMLLTEGTVEREGRIAADALKLEVVDGQKLWPMLKPYMDPVERDRIVGGARDRAKRHTFIATFGALALGTVVAIGHASLNFYEASSAEAMAGTASQATAVPAGPPAATMAAKPPALAVAPGTKHVLPGESEAIDPNPDEAGLERQRVAVAKALQKAPGLIRGAWLTKMTLAVDAHNDDPLVWDVICREVERYPALRTVRVQLNPPPGSDEPTRWRQCKTQ